MNESPSPAREATRRFLGLRLAEGTTKPNLAAFYWSALFGLTLFTTVGALQPFALTTLAGVPLAEQGRAVGRLGLINEITTLLTVGVFGALSDRRGRRLVMTFGFTVMSLGYLFYARSTSFSDLMTARFVFSIGSAAVTAMLSTIIADYVIDPDRGKATGWLGFFNGIGAMLTATVFLALPRILERRGLTFEQALVQSFFIAAAVGALSAIVMATLLKPGRESAAAERVPFVRLLREGVRAARDPKIALAYAAAFVSRGDLALVGQFLILWLNKAALATPGLSEKDALTQAQIPFIITQTAALFSAPLFGRLTDKVNRVTGVMIAALVAGLGYSTLFLIENPLGPWMKVALLLVGAGEVGGVIASQVLIAQYAAPEFRGSITGMFSLCGALGILVAFGVGGYLFDHWRESGPFLLFGVLGLFISLWAYRLRRATPA